ncbi:MAG: YncE family protein, partial [Nitrososphaeraceae archaeon]
MQNGGTIQCVFIFLVILNCIVLLSVFTLSNLTYAQEIQKLHQKTLDELSKHPSTTQNAHIIVGHGPSAIGVATGKGKVYVANSDNNTVSVINEKNNAKIVDIKVANGPFAIGVAPDKVYVANYLNNTVSVINEKNNAKIVDIKVGNGPFAIGVAPDKVY